MRLLIDHVKWRGRFAGHCQILARSVSDVGIATVMNASFEGYVLLGWLTNNNVAVSDAQCLVARMS